MYKRQDVVILTTVRENQGVLEVRAGTRFYGSYSASFNEVEDGGATVEGVAKESARAMLHRTIYGDVADELHALSLLAESWHDTGKALGNARWHDGDCVDLLMAHNNAEKAYREALQKLTDKLEIHP